jgi:SOS response associated peptidase (SRAP)
MIMEIDPECDGNRTFARVEVERCEGVIETCTILTTAANTVLAPIHDRMPVILPQTDYAQWLDPAPKNKDTLSPLLVPFPPEDMLAIPVSPRVNAPQTMTSADDLDQHPLASPPVELAVEDLLPRAEVEICRTKAPSGNSSYSTSPPCDNIARTIPFQ